MDERRQGVNIQGHDTRGVRRGECSDGSRRDGHTAAATTKEGYYLEQLVTVMDAEMLGVAMG